MFTGELLERVSVSVGLFRSPRRSVTICLSKGWVAFKTIDELFILVPIILNLKGNLEMNLSARLSIAANLSDLDNRLSLLQV